jgi:Sulfotransferase family
MASVLRASCREEGRAATAPRRRTGRPTLRLVHHMARSGGTPISRCLGCMSGVLLLSEIHPLGTAQFNPLVQAQRWYGLLSSRDLAELKARHRIGFVDAIELIHQRAVDAGQRLVIRDWSHLDFTGVPFVANPAFRLLTAEALAGRFELRQICTVRHPLDQWLSLRGLAVVQGKLTLERYLAGYRRFAEQARAIGFLRYEDFVADPDAVMRELCRHLELRFDCHFAERWSSYAFVTGDVSGSRGGSGIQPVPRRPAEPGLLDLLPTNPDYVASLELLGYAHPSPDADAAEGDAGAARSLLPARARDGGFRADPAPILL